MTTSVDKFNIAKATSDSDLINILDAEFGRRRNAMSRHYRRWDVAEKFYEGEQWVRYDYEENKVRNMYRTFARGRDLIMVNRIAEYVRIMGAQLGTGKPDIGFIPATQATEDVSASKMSRAIYEYVNRINDTHVLNHRLHQYKLLYGTAIKAIDWSKLKGENNVVEEIVHPREILPRLDSKGDFDQVIRFRYVELATVKSTYGRDDINSDMGGSDSNNTGSNKDLFNMASTNRFHEPILLKEYYEEASDDFPQGLYVAWAGDKVLERKSSIYEDGRTPFIRHIFDLACGDAFWGLAYVTPLIPLQVLLNKTMTMINEFIKRSIKLIVAVERGSDVDPDALQKSDLFSVVPYNRNSRTPTTIPMTQLSVDPWRQLEMIEAQLMDLAHVHLVTKGMAERNVRSDLAQRTLKEQDEHPLSITVQNFEQGEVEAAQMKLQLARQFYPEDKLITVVGRNNNVHVMSFKRSLIEKEVDIIVTPNSAMPSSRALQQAFVLDMFKANMLDPNDPTNKLLIREMVQYQAMDVMFEEEERAKSQALAEHEAIRKGEVVDALPIENHFVHKKTHRDMILSEDFQDWQEAEQTALRLHWQRHEDLEDLQIEKVARRMAMLQGQPLESAEAMISQAITQKGKE